MSMKEWEAAPQHAVLTRASPGFRHENMPTHKDGDQQRVQPEKNSPLLIRKREGCAAAMTVSRSRFDLWCLSSVSSVIFMASKSSLFVF